MKQIVRRIIYSTKTSKTFLSLSHSFALVSFWGIACVFFYSSAIAEPIDMTLNEKPLAPLAVTPLEISSLGALFVDLDRSPLVDPATMDQFVENLNTMPFGEIILKVYGNGEAYYHSSIAPCAPSATTDDPLVKLISKLHAARTPRKITLWLDLYSANERSDPQWLSPSSNKTELYRLEPGLGAVQAYLESIVQELTRYDVDGFYFDTMGDPGAEWGVHPILVQKWRQQTHASGSAQPLPSDPSWIEFRAQLPTIALSELIRVVRQLNPRLILTVGGDACGPAPVAFNEKSLLSSFRKTETYLQRHQNWFAWMTPKDPTLRPDRMILKNFYCAVSKPEQFDSWTKFGMTVTKAAKIPVLIGIDGRINDAVDIHYQMRLAMEQGASGVALSSYAQPTRDPEIRPQFMQTIACTVLSKDYVNLLTQPSSADARSAMLTTLDRVIQSTRGNSDQSSLTKGLVTTDSVIQIRPVFKNNVQVASGHTPSSEEDLQDDPAPSQFVSIPSPEPLEPHDVELPPPPYGLIAAPYENDDHRKVTLMGTDETKLESKTVSKTSRNRSSASSKPSQRKNDVSLSTLKKLADIPDPDNMLGFIADLDSAQDKKTSKKLKRRDRIGVLVDTDSGARAVKPSDDALRQMEQHFGITNN